MDGSASIQGNQNQKASRIWVKKGVKDTDKVSAKADSAIPPNANPMSLDAAVPSLIPPDDDESGEDSRDNEATDNLAVLRADDVPDFMDKLVPTDDDPAKDVRPKKKNGKMDMLSLSDEDPPEEIRPKKKKGSRNIDTQPEAEEIGSPKKAPKKQKAADDYAEDMDDVVPRGRSHSRHGRKGDHNPERTRKKSKNGGVRVRVVRGSGSVVRCVSRLLFPASMGRKPKGKRAISPEQHGFSVRDPEEDADVNAHVDSSMRKGKVLLQVSKASKLQEENSNSDHHMSDSSNDESDDELSVTISDSSSHLIGRVLGKNFKFDFLSSQLQAKWGAYAGFRINDLGNGCFILFFADKESRDQVWLGGPWHVAGRAVGLDRCLAALSDEEIDKDKPLEENADAIAVHAQDNRSKKNKATQANATKPSNVNDIVSPTGETSHKNKTADDYLLDVDTFTRGRSRSRPGRKGQSSPHSVLGGAAPKRPSSPVQDLVATSRAPVIANKKLFSSDHVSLNLFEHSGAANPGSDSSQESDSDSFWGSEKSANSVSFSSCIFGVRGNDAVKSVSNSSGTHAAKDNVSVNSSSPQAHQSKDNQVLPNQAASSQGSIDAIMNLCGVAQVLPAPTRAVETAKEPSGANKAHDCPACPAAPLPKLIASKLSTRMLWLVEQWARTFRFEWLAAQLHRKWGAFEGFPSAPGLPLSFWGDKNLCRNVYIIGELMFIDAFTKSRSRTSFARFCVRQDSATPLFGGLLLNSANTGKVFQKLVYEGIGSLCTSCGFTEHGDATCASVAPIKNVEVRNPQEGLDGWTLVQPRKPLQQKAIADSNKANWQWRKVEKPAAPIPMSPATDCNARTDAPILPDVINLQEQQMAIDCHVQDGNVSINKQDNAAEPNQQPPKDIAHPCQENFPNDHANLDVRRPRSPTRKVYQASDAVDAANASSAAGVAGQAGAAVPNHVADVPLGKNILIDPVDADEAVEDVVRRARSPTKRPRGKSKSRERSVLCRDDTGSAAGAPL
ncbi:hypothetical protein KSP40_PGU015216 [Platanthera guangdongensis]|uniref:DUF4283 domain-containing protein n=1 Tax=Platanthera guangdongensis TaxID=2320717 RepID=A0ABR2M1G5_9ASPA